MIRLILKIPNNKREMTIEYNGVKIDPIGETWTSQ
jgi:hypothetical protein